MVFKGQNASTTVPKKIDLEHPVHDPGMPSTQ